MEAENKKLQKSGGDQGDVRIRTNQVHFTPGWSLLYS